MMIMIESVSCFQSPTKASLSTNHFNSTYNSFMSTVHHSLDIEIAIVFLRIAFKLQFSFVCFKPAR